MVTIAMRFHFVEDHLDCWTLQRLAHWAFLPQEFGRLDARHGAGECLAADDSATDIHRSKRTQLGAFEEFTMT